MSNIDFLTKEQWSASCEIKKLIKIEDLPAIRDKAYNEGWQAGVQGYTHSSNTYLKSQIQYHWWHEGWLSYMKQFKEIQLDPVVDKIALERTAKEKAIITELLEKQKEMR